MWHRRLETQATFDALSTLCTLSQLVIAGLDPAMTV